MYIFWGTENKHYGKRGKNAQAKQSKSKLRKGYTGITKCESIFSF